MMRHRAVGIGDSCQAVYMPEMDCGGGCGDLVDRIVELQTALDNLDYRMDNAESDINGMEGDINGLDGRLDVIEPKLSDKSNVNIGIVDHAGDSKTVQVLGHVQENPA